MFRQKPVDLKYICYLSSAKVENLYSQIATMDINRVQLSNEAELNGQFEGSGTIKKIIQTGLSFGARKTFYRNEEGCKNDIQKFRDILAYCSKHGLVASLEECLSGKKPANTPVLYTVSGNFNCNCNRVNNRSFLDKEKKEADENGTQLGFAKTIGEMVYLTTHVGNKNLYLACSYKYFSDMGASRICIGSEFSENDHLKIYPHSGNFFFFNGTVDATFEAIFILNGQKENILFGSPLALINDFSSDLII